MKTMRASFSGKTQVLSSLVLLLSLFSWSAAYAQITPSGDSYTNTADPTTNYGAKTLLDVDGATQTTYIQFDLASIPAGASVSQATLKLYVNAVTTAGSFNVDYVNGAWRESTIDASNAPALGTTIASDVAITTGDKNQYILIDITPAVQAWLSGSTANDGIALVANSTFNATFDSKENTGTSHPAELDLVVAGNIFMGNETVDGNLSATGVVSSAGFEIGSNLFDYGSYSNGNAFLGFAGNTTMAGLNNTASGWGALSYNTTGSYNTASGWGALLSNTTGSSNTATGGSALLYNTTGSYNTAGGAWALNSNTTASYNTASGWGALHANTTGYGNTANGYSALYYNTTSCCNVAVGNNALYFNTGVANTGVGNNAGATLYQTGLTGSNNTALGTGTVFGTGSVTNATAIGANAEVDTSNSLVLGSVNGYNNQTVSTNVGIGTTTPQAALDVVGNNMQILLGDPGCGSGLAGIGFVQVGGFNACNNFGLVGKAAGDLYVNSVLSGSIHFRNNNGSDLMTIDTSGDVAIKGTISKGSGTFKIDHPLDPANKYLYHSFVESPDMMNVYNGNVVTNQRGVAIVTLPDYFEALNRDFRYQLTVIGQFAQAIVAKKIANNRFVIRTNKPGVEVSWQVTGIRHDAYADAHRIQVEVEKPPQEQGHYLHPELFGAPPEDAVGAQAGAVTRSGPHASH